MSDDTRPGPAAALEALGQAAHWAAQAVPAVGDDDVAAFECVIALDQAVAHVADLLRSLPELLRVAAPGQAVGDRLAAAQAELDRQRSELAAERARLTAALNLEQRAAGLQAERDLLRARIEELERASLIERELPALRARQCELEAAIPVATASEGAEVVAGLAAAARHVLELTGEQQALIQAANGQLVTALADATAAVAREQARREELTAQLAAQEQQARQLAAEVQRTLPGLRARQEADSALAAGLTAGGLTAGDAATRVSAQLTAIGQRVAAAEDLLRPLLLQHAQAYDEARRARGWTG